VTYDRKSEEYSADFLLIAKRHLDERDHKLFKYHFLLGADWKLCCSKLGIDRGLFFHGIYRIQQKLGKAYRETKPYPLFPVYEYFADIRQPVAASRTEPGKTEAATSGRRISRIMPGSIQEPYPGQRMPRRRLGGETEELTKPRKIA